MYIFDGLGFALAFVVCLAGELPGAALGATALLRTPPREGESRAGEAPKKNAASLRGVGFLDKVYAFA
ncbi:hypothetical protein J2T07_000917 [Luteibacter jiangsuensis]|uniref:Uncharacterized protein n=1 Tax=Luteibacter jiangsuensis TaxID=637577 RepID=A0ABT9SUU2_9GAMM|nr:hypothetical protein [Luteibacter jiangsuensis]